MNNSFRSPTYLVKNPYSYCFRMKVPADLHNLATTDFGICDLTTTLMISMYLKYDPIRIILYNTPNVMIYRSTY